MEHPEKALFEEVLALKKDIEESKERVSKLKNDYEEKIVMFEKRSLIKDRSEEKFKKWQKLSKKKVTFQLDEKEYTFLRATFDNNLYKLNSRFLPEDESNIFIDAQKSFFKLFILMITKGNSEFNRRNNSQNTNEDNNNLKKFAKVLDKSTREDKNFLKFLQEIFSEESFHDVLNNFNLDLEILPKNNLFEKYEITGPYTSNIGSYVTDSVVSLADKNSKKGFFLGYNGNLDIELGETVRVKRIFVKPFMSDTVIWTPTSGATYTNIYASTDGKNWEHSGIVPSYYGNSANNYHCEIVLNNFYTFRFIRFSTATNAYFSLSYLAFKK